MDCDSLRQQVCSSCEQACCKLIISTGLLQERLFQQRLFQQQLTSCNKPDLNRLVAT